MTDVSAFIISVIISCLSSLLLFFHKEKHGGEPRFVVPLKKYGNLAELQGLLAARGVIKSVTGTKRDWQSSSECR